MPSLRFPLNLYATCALAAFSSAAHAQTPSPPKTTTPYTTPANQTALAFGDRSHYLQPWRAYQVTPPTSRLRDAVGINLNVSPAQSDAVSAELERDGFVRNRNRGKIIL